jgi:anti-sigma-K factor RskA
MANNIPTTPDNADPCRVVLELIPAYVMGATDPEETRFVERHLKDCPEALSELQIYGDLNDDLLFGAPPVLAPPHLAAKISRIPGATSASRVIKIPLPVQPIRPLWSNPIALAVAAVAALGLFVLVNAYWLGQIQDLQRREEQQTAALQVAGAEDTTFTLLVSNEVVAFNGRVMWSPTHDAAVLQVAGLPATASDQEYQLWLINGNLPVSGGTFRVDTSGEGLLVFEPPAPLDTYAQIGITVEPAGGSEQPTTAPVVTGEI